MSQVSIIDITGSHPDIPTTFNTDDGSAIPIANVLEILAQTVPAGSIPIQTTGSGNTVTIEAQISQAIAATDATKIGLAAFNSSNFSVDANGFVSLVNSGDFIDSIGVDGFTAPGTNPVVPDVNGLITVNGAQVANGTTANAVRTFSLAPNVYQIQIQRTGGAVAGNSALNGVAHFNNTQFTVGSDGFVSLIGGSVAIDSINVDASTPPGTDPVVPDAGGQITVTGAQVATGTVGTNVIRTNSLAVNTYTIEIQRSTSAAATDVTLNGVAHFDSARFTVDANGFVSASGTGLGQTITGDSGGSLSPTAGNWNILGGPGVTTSGSGSTLTINSVVFTDRAVSATVTSDSGSFCTAAGVTLTLPSAPAQGELLQFACMTSDTLIIDAPSTHLIRIGSLVSSAGGTATSTLIGDSLTLRYYAATTTWIATSVVGTWVIA